jgi:hypothetical protein
MWHCTENVDEAGNLADHAVDQSLGRGRSAVAARVGTFQRNHMSGIRAFLTSTAGKITTGALLTAAIAFLVYRAMDTFGGGEVVANNRNRMFIDAENGKTFRHEISVGDTIPVVSPFSGKPTGYEAEACFWTKDGKAKTQPTWVLLNTHKGKPEPTFCPDCGRLVVPLNPAPGEGQKPPPTEEERKSRSQTGRD